MQPTHNQLSQHIARTEYTDTDIKHLGSTLHHNVYTDESATVSAGFCPEYGDKPEFVHVSAATTDEHSRPESSCLYLSVTQAKELHAKLERAIKDSS